MYSNSGNESKAKLVTQKVNFRKGKSKFRNRSSVFELLHIWLLELGKSGLPTHYKAHTDTRHICCHISENYICIE